MSATTITILVGAICLLAGVVGGFFLARRNFMNYMEKNPQINEDMVMAMILCIIKHSICSLILIENNYIENNYNRYHISLQLAYFSLI